MVVFGTEFCCGNQFLLDDIGQITHKLCVRIMIQSVNLQHVTLNCFGTSLFVICLHARRNSLKLSASTLLCRYLIPSIGS